MMFRRILHDQSGSVLILTAVSLVMLLTLVAFSMTAGMAFDKRNQYAAAADAAAKSGAQEAFRNPGITDAQLAVFGSKELARVGLSAATLQIHHCTTGGATCTAPNNTSSFVEAIVFQNMNTFMSSLLPAAVVQPKARAVAGTAAGGTCIVTFQNLTMGGTVSMAGCSISVGGVMNAGGGTVTASSVGIVGGAGNCTNCGGVSPAPVDIPTPSDPLASLPAVSDPGLPSPNPGSNCSTPTTPLIVDATVASTPINPGKYCGWSFTAKSQTLTLNPGTYYLTGPVDSSNPGRDVWIAGSGVTIYIAPGGSFDVNSNGVDINLSAPTSGTYKSILFFQDRANAAAAAFSKNNGQLVLSGALYFKNASLSMSQKNGIQFGGCTLFVAQSLTLGYSGTITNTCSAYGGSPIMTTSLSE